MNDDQLLNVPENSTGDQNAEQVQEKLKDKDKKKDQEPMTFNDLLKDPKNQSEFDKRVAKAIETAKAKWEADAQLTAEQRHERALTEREQELERREREQEQREFFADVKEEVLAIGLPVTMAELISRSTTRDNYKQFAHTLKAEWDSELQEQIKAGARQKDPLASQTTKPVSGNVALDITKMARENRKVK